MRTQKASASRSPRPSLEEIVRRIEVLERYLGPSPGKRRRMDLAAMTLRSNIIEEDRLRREIAREQALLSEHPDYWKQRERERIARNRESAALTRRLRAAGLRAAYRELSLKQKLKKLQRLVNQNRAETEIFRQTK